MKKLLTIAVVFFLVGVWISHAQSGPIQYFAPGAGTTVTNCGTPTSGFPLCGVATGWYIWNGTAWMQLGMASTGGVTSISVNGGAAQTGAVAISVPTVATTTIR